MSSPLSTGLTSGVIGAAILTLTHQTGYWFASGAPRTNLAAMDWTLAGDLVVNSLYYSAVPGASCAATWQRGVLLGLVAGIGALALPELLGVGTMSHVYSRRHRLLTLACFIAGGMAAAAAANRIAELPRVEADVVDKQA